ncbi:hypothetical protein LCL95_11065 [Bacillus timonensis]|nr:hypothetical protein [Bacillus timonensis]
MNKMKVTLQEINSSHINVLGNLLEYYVYEFSKYIESIKIREDGTYGFGDLTRYFNNNEYHCYLFEMMKI